MSAAPMRNAPGSMAATREFVSRHALLLIVAAAALLRFATLASQDFWFDEYLTLDIIQRRPGDMLERIMVAEANPPLYYLVAAAWERVFGDSEVGLRSLSALLGTATIPVIYAGARSLGSRGAALTAAALAAASPMLIWYSQEARTYSMLVFLTALGFWCFARLLAGERAPVWLWGWAIASILALSTHYLAAIVIAVEGLWLLWVRRGARLETGLAIATVVAAGAVLIPLAAAQQDFAVWIQLLDLGDRLDALPQHFVVGLTVPASFIGPAATLVVVAVAAWSATRVEGPNRRLAAIGATVAAIGFVIALTAALTGHDYLITRNVIGLAVPIAIVLGALLGTPAATRLGPPVAAAVCALGAGLAIWTAATPAAGRPDWGAVVAGLGTPTTERVVITEEFGAAVGHYLDGARKLIPAESVTATEVDVIEPRPVENYSIGPCWWTGFCGGQVILGMAPLPLEVPPQFEVVSEGSSDLFDYRRYVSDEPVALPGPTNYEGAFLQSPE